MPSPLYVETRVAASLDALWSHSQDPALHSRWDLRFSSITPCGIDERGHQRFRYATRLLPFLTVSGDGVNTGERHRPDGGCTSALRFASGHPLSLIATGSGYWRYQPASDAVRFLTGYDYRPRWGVVGRVLDALVVRPLMGWATAWSFDRLRIWLETGVTPERSRNRGLAEVVLRLALVGLAATLHPALALLALPAALLVPPTRTSPAARRCRRRPSRPVRAPRIADSLESR
ncbi:MAG TPA: hypothetical protein VGE38_07905 [Nocardioides sp.]|uniref:hypothetical protein n=1 Tax=Nocardioides sp. TaxID=35761 RepID=UPI002EDA15E5